MGLFDKYKTIEQNIWDKGYLYCYEYNGVKWIELTANGWTRIIHDVLDERIKNEFNLLPIKDRCWANDYVDGRRKVISLFLVNDMFATFKWGWNFAYIPRITGSKCIWARTDKSIYTHTFRVSDEFINGMERRRKSVFGREPFKKREELSLIIKEIETAYEFVKSDIWDYFKKTAEYDGMISELESIRCDNYYRFINPDNELVYIGVENYIGNVEKAQKDFTELSFKNDELKTEFSKKIGLPVTK